MDTLIRFKKELSSIRILAEKLIDEDPDYILTPKGVLHISKRPQIGSEAYALVLYPGINESDLTEYESNNELKIPDIYRNILFKLNGAFIFKISLFGVSPLIDRSSLNPHDVATANKFWKLGYKSAKNFFHFGVGPWSEKEDVGYFIDAEGLIKALLKSGENVNTWNDFSDFINSEIARAEKEYPKFEKFMFNLRKKSH